MEVELGEAFGAETIDEVVREFMPKKKEKKEKKDDKKEKKKEVKKKKKDKITLTTVEKLQVKNLINNMIFGLSEKDKKSTTVIGWVNMISEKQMSSQVPWEFQLAQVMYRGLEMEYRCKKKKEIPALMTFYDQMQSLADAINSVRKQYKFSFKDDEMEKLLSINDALSLQNRLQQGSAGVTFDLCW